MAASGIGEQPDSHDLLGRCSGAFPDPTRAAAEITRLARGASPRALKLATLLSTVPDPEGALGSLGRLSEAGRLPERDEALRALILLAGHSAWLAEVIQVDGRALEAAIEARRQPVPAADGVREALRRSLRTSSPGGFWRSLRSFKERQIAAIALRDFHREWPMTEVVEQLSFLADAIVAEALGRALSEAMAEFGAPLGYDASGRRKKATATVMALGKLGGLELNYSSDVDLLFLYSHDGETRGAGSDPATVITNKEFFTRVAEILTRGLSAPEGGGWILRVDWGLRPGGKDGDLALPLHATVAYYRTWARPWERQALIKARTAAGDGRLGRRFISQIQELVYPRAPEADATDAIRVMKDRIDASLAGSGRTGFDLKLGRGGIREIEFHVQGLQILHAGPDPWLRDPNSQRALHRLAERGHLSRAEHATLTAAYQFLREAEHRIQIRQNLQRSTLPSDERELVILARAMSYADLAPGRAAEMFLADLDRHRGEVRQLYDAFIASQSQKRLERPIAPDLFLDPMSDSEMMEILSGAGCSDPGALVVVIRRARRHLTAPSVPVENRRAFRQVTPVILRGITSVASAPRSLRNLERLLESLAVDPAGMMAFLERPERFAPILRLFGGSQPLSDLLIHRPALMLDPAFDRALASDRTLTAHVAAVRARVRSGGSFAGNLAALRHYQQEELLLIGLKDLSRQMNIRAVRRALTDLAEACVRGAYAAAVSGMRFEGRPVPRHVSVLGLGRLGYREMDYGSDLDLVFLYHAAGADAATHAAACDLATRVVEALDTITREGPLYAVDTRLRPFGAEGEMAQTSASLLDYLREQAGVWEMQAYLKARCVAGDLRAGERAVRRAEQAILERASREDPGAAIRAMRERLRAASEHPDEDLKSGIGGTYAIQFTLQYLQLRHHVPSPPARNTLRLMRTMRDLDLIGEKSYTLLFKAERFLRRLEHQLRLIHGRSVTRIPENRDLLAEVAAGLGYDGPPEEAVESLGRDLRANRAAAEEAFERVISPGAAGGRH